MIWPPDYRPGEDPADFGIRLGSFSAFKAAVQMQRFLPWEWMARRIAQKYTSTPEGKLHARQEAVAFASTQRLVGIALGDFLRGVADVTGGTVEELKAEISPAGQPPQGQ